MRRAVRIFLLACMGVWSPSLGRRYRVRDIWERPKLDEWDWGV